MIKCRKLEQENRHDWLIDWLDEQKNRQLIDWLTRRTKKSTIDSFRRHENVLCKFFIQLTKVRSVTSWFFQRIWIERQMNNIHRSQRENFFINANSRSFSLIHDAHSESEMQSSFSKRKFQIDDFLLTRVFLRMIRRFSLITRVSLRTYLTILFCLFAYLDEQFVSTKRLTNVN